jgi:hypothetical protein
MPFALVTIGVMLFASAINGTAPALASQLYKDIFTNKPPFLWWASALLIVGFIGYIPGLKKPADAFMILIIIGIALANGGFFAKFSSAIQSPASSGSGSTATTAASAPLQATPLSLAAAMNEIGAAGNDTPVTTPVPTSTAFGSTPLGFGGIGSA